MKTGAYSAQPLVLGLLIVVNLTLLAALFAWPDQNQRIVTPRVDLPPPLSMDTNAPGFVPPSALASLGSTSQSSVARPSAPETVFTAVYSPDIKLFAANLRATRCPEETVKDILAAEVHRRFGPQEEALRPKPSDHVPFSWSAQTTEPRLLERRQQAASLARDEAAMLREALGYEVPVSMPLYARTTSDEQFGDALTNLPAAKRDALSQIQEAYWSGVQVLQQRTKGFWLAQDVADLQTLKDQRKQALAAQDFH